MTSIGAYIPCFNNQTTIRQSIESVLKQTIPISELVVVDDHSDDDSPSIVKSMGIRLVQLEEHFGRGAVRARGMLELSQEYVLSVDGTKRIGPDFVDKALPHFKGEKVGAVFAKMVEGPAKTVTDRWRDRHLIKSHVLASLDRHAALSTSAALTRRSTILQIGNYNHHFGHSEDRDLGERLLSSGFEVIYDPNLIVVSMKEQNLWQTLERYWRWNAGVHQQVNPLDYLKQIVYSIKVMAKEDLTAGDPLAVPISLLSPHYQFWRSLVTNR